MVLACPNINTKEWKDLVSAVGDVEAYRDYIETNGEIRHYATVFEKVNSRSESPSLGSSFRVRRLMEATDKVQFAAQASLVKQLRNLERDIVQGDAKVRKNLVSNAIFGKLSDDDFVYLSIPKMATEKTLSSKDPFGTMEKDQEGLRLIKEFIANQEAKGVDMSFIQIKSTEKANLIRIPRKVYYASRKDISTPEAFVQYYKGDEPGAVGIDSGSLMGNAIIEGGAPGVTPQESNNARSMAFLTSFARDLSSRLLLKGKAMSSSFITTAEAIEILGQEEYDKATANGKFSIKGFFKGDTVYFVGDNLNMDMVFHEFSHPVIRSIMKVNPELASKLYYDMANSTEGKAIIDEVRRKYPELAEDSDQFKEEALVWGLTKAADLEATQTKPTSGFVKWLKNMLFKIRQFFRNEYKSDFSKLSVNTSMKALAEMLKSSQEFELNDEVVSEDDAVAYVKDMKSEIEDMLKIDPANRNAISMRQYDIAVKHIDLILSNRNYKEIMHLLLDEYERGDLQEIRRNLSKFSRPMDEKLKNMRDQISHNKAHAEAMVNSLFRLQNIVKKIENHLKTLKEDTDNKENMMKAFYYRHFLEFWDKFADEVGKALSEADVESDSPLANLVSSIKRSSENADRHIASFYQKGVADVIFETLNPAAKRIAQKHADIIRHLQMKKAPQKLIDKAMEEFYGLSQEELTEKERLTAKVAAGTGSFEDIRKLEALKVKSFNGAQITKEKIEMALEGKMKDANVFNSFFEGYMYNTDPIVGGFATYVKNHMMEVEALVQKKANLYIDEMAPLLEAAGYNPVNVNGLIEKIAIKQKIGRYNNKGEWEEKDIWTLQSEHKDWRIALDRLTKAVNDAEKEHLLTGTEEAYEKYMQAMEVKKAHVREYFYDKYDPKVYSAQKLLEKDDIGRKAAIALDQIMDEINSVVRPLTTQTDELNALERLDGLWKKRARLFSLLDDKGQPKDRLSDDYKIAVRLNEYREANKDPLTGKSYHEWKLRKGLFENSFEQYQQELVNAGMDPKTPEFREKEREWLEKNTRVAISEKYFDDYKEIMDAIKKILENAPNNEKVSEELSAVWKKIFDMTSDKRDDDGQPDGGLFTEEQLATMQELQQKVKDLEEELEGYTGLTKLEQFKLSGYRNMIKEKIKFSEDDKKEFEFLKQKSLNLGIPGADRLRLQGLFKKLRNLKSTEATPYYYEVVNNWLAEMDQDAVKAYFPAGKIETEQEAEKLLQSSAQTRFFSLSPDFEKWFKANHIAETAFSYEEGNEYTKWSRIHAWNATRPIQDKHYESVTIRYADGKNEVMLRAPKLKYYIRAVKSQYKTERVVGKTVDNQGNFLPRMDVPDSPYIDRDYLAMEKNDPAHFAVLEAMKRHHLANQEGVPKKSRLYLDVPRFRKNNLELLRTRTPKEITKMASQGKLPLLHALLERARNFFKGSKDEAGVEQNWKDDTILMRLDMYDTETTSIPVFGLSDVGIDDVSPDLNESILRYMSSLEKQRKLIEINPVAQALKTTLNNPDNMISDEFNKINKFNFLHKQLITYKKKKGIYVRKWAVNNFIEREFEGKVDAGFTKDIYSLQNFGNLLFKRASFSFFALNIPSALKNALGAKFQSMVEASAGVYVDHPSMAKGEAWSSKTMAEISLSLYKRDVKPLNIQLADAFDAIRGRAEEKQARTLSRTFAHDLADFSWLYNFRKWTQGQAELQLFSGMMYKHKVDQNGKKIDYMDAWEVRDKILTLKEGIDVRYSNAPTTFTVQPGETVKDLAERYNIPAEEAEEVFGKEVKPGREVTIDNNKFKDFKNTMHTVQMDLNGAYDRFNQPEANRYLAFRFVAFMKKYFTTMLMNRWGFSGGIMHAKGRFVPGLGDTREGYYITVIKTLHRTFTTGEMYFPYMTPTEKKAWIKFMVEVGSVIALLMVVAPLLGWDPEDPDRYEKLRDRSGSLPFFGADADPEHPFDAGGFLMNHMLKLTLDVRSENEAFIPFPGFGLDNYSDTAMDASSVSFGPTLKSYKKMLEYLYMEVTGNPYAKYQKEAGAYNWQEEGGSKLATEFAKALGLTGSSIDPVTSIKNTHGSKHK